MPARKEAFTVRKYEADAFGALAPPALSGYLSEIAGHHAQELGVGIDALMAKGVTWVLARLRMENPVAAGVGDEVEVETWPSGIERLFALREFVVRRGGEEVARASSQWLVLDLATRKPVRPGEVLDARFPREPTPPVAPLAGRKLPEVREREAERRFRVRYADIDQNLHVTNTSYLSWAIEAMPEEVWRSSRLASVEIHFVAETLLGAAVLSRLRREDAEGTYGHAIVREEDGKELARLATRWVPR